MEILIEKKPKMTFVCSRFFASPLNIANYRPLTNMEKRKFVEFSDVFHDEYESDSTVREYVEKHNIGEYCVFQKQDDYVLQAFAGLDDNYPSVQGFKKMYYGGKVVVFRDKGTKAELQRKLFDVAVKFVSLFGTNPYDVGFFVEHFSRVSEDENLYEGEIWIMLADKMNDIVEDVLTRMKKDL